MSRSTLAVLASTLAILISIPARAADLPSPVQPVAPVAYAPSFSWTGFYFGGELGWIGTNPEYTAVVEIGSANQTGLGPVSTSGCHDAASPIQTNPIA